MTSVSFSIRVSVAALLLASSAAAQTDAVAENLFRDGKKLLAAKKYDEACPKFAESARMSPSSGVELALGICYEADGKIASAWGAYSAVIGLARRDARKDRERAATTHLRALEAKLARVTFVVPAGDAALEGYALHQDDIELGSAAWTGTPIDPGEHKLEVQAPGHVTYSTTFTIPTTPGVQTVTVPPLALVPPPPPVVAPVVVAPPPPPPAPSPLRPIGYAVGGVGIASVIAGSVLGGVALGKANSVHSSCPGGKCTSASAVSEDSTAGTLADASTGTFIAGGALVAAGLVLVLTAPSTRDDRAPAPSPPTAAAWIRPFIAPGYAGFRGTF